MTARRGRRAPRGEDGRSYEDIARHFTSLDAYRDAEPWLRGDTGRRVAACVVRCGCGRELVRAFMSSASQEQADLGVFVRTPDAWSQDDAGHAKLRLSCRCGARPQVTAERLRVALAAVLVIGEDTACELTVR